MPSIPSAAQFAGDHLLGFAAEDELAEADQEVGQADGRHQQDDVGLVDQRPHHEALHRKRQKPHHPDGQDQRQIGRNALLVQADQRQPANTTMMPCAKLNTPEALKISTKPSAISA
jgi:hypothetical protein